MVKGKSLKNMTSLILCFVSFVCLPTLIRDYLETFLWKSKPPHSLYYSKKGVYILNFTFNYSMSGKLVMSLKVFDTLINIFFWKEEASRE